MIARIMIAFVAALALSGARASSPATLPMSLQVRDIQGAVVQPLEVPGRIATALIFVAHDCPISNAYSAEVARLRADYAASHVGFYVVYTDTGVTRTALLAHAQAHGYVPFALLDPTHTLVGLTGVTVTPETVVLSHRGRVLYEGRIDDRFTGFGRARDVASICDLRRALNAIRLGKPVTVARTQAVGCYIPGV